MAWKRRYQGFRSKASAWAGRRSKRTKSVLGVGMPFLVGAALGLTDIDKAIPVELKLGVACIPGNLLPGMGPARSFAQGLVVGDLIQARTGFSLGGAGVGNSSGSGVL